MQKRSSGREGEIVWQWEGGKEVDGKGGRQRKKISLQ